MGLIFGAHTYYDTTPTGAINPRHVRKARFRTMDSLSSKMAGSDRVLARAASVNHQDGKLVRDVTISAQRGGGAVSWTKEEAAGGPAGEPLDLRTC
jgi:hypothetical protein